MQAIRTMTPPPPKANKPITEQRMLDIRDSSGVTGYEQYDEDYFPTEADSISSETSSA